MMVHVLLLKGKIIPRDVWLKINHITSFGLQPLLALDRFLKTGELAREWGITKRQWYIFSS